MSMADYFKQKMAAKTGGSAEPAPEGVRRSPRLSGAEPTMAGLGMGLGFGGGGLGLGAKEEEEEEEEKPKKKAKKEEADKEEEGKKSSSQKLIRRLLKGADNEMKVMNVRVIPNLSPDPDRIYNSLTLTLTDPGGEETGESFRGGVLEKT